MLGGTELVTGALAAIAEAMPDAIVVAGADGLIAFANSQAEELFGYPAGLLLGQPIEVLVPEAVRATHVPRRQGFFANPETRTMGVGLELTAQRSDGGQFPVEISLSALRTDDETLAFAAIRDVTNRRRHQAEILRLNAELNLLNEDLRHKLAELQTTNDELESFSYSVSHDLRSPLRAVAGFAGIVSNEYGAELPAPVLDYLRKIRASAEKMGQLIDALLMLSRVHRAEMLRQEIDMSALASSVWEDLATDDTGAGVDFSLSDLPPAEGDPRLIRQLLQNLIGNAVKYSRDSTPSRVEVTAHRLETENVYQVRDNGVGFDRRYVGKLFRVFQRLHRPEQFEGTGIGLALCARIVSRHGGRIWANGTLGEGATFSFALPRRKDHA